MISIWEYPLFSVMNQQGSMESVGLWQLFEKAHEYKDICADSFTGKMSLYRLCLAFLMDIFEPEDTDSIADLFSSGHFDMNCIREYKDRCESEGVCFDLGDEKKPFLQATYVPEMDDKALKSIATLMFDVPSGNNHIHLDHRLENEHEVSVKKAFEAMLATYTFCVSGTAGPSNVNNTPPMMALIHGRDLFETLVLNMVSKESVGNIKYGKPVWREPVFAKPYENVISMTLLQAMTWQPRRITLVIGDGETVRNAYVQAGLNFKGNDLWKDPYALYRQTKDSCFEQAVKWELIEKNPTDYASRPKAEYAKLNGGDIKSVQGDTGHAQARMVAEVYSHILDEDRKSNAQLFQETFYEKKEEQPALPNGITPEILVKILEKPEMAALLTSLAQTL